MSFYSKYLQEIDQAVEVAGQLGEPHLALYMLVIESFRDEQPGS